MPRPPVILAALAAAFLLLAPSLPAQEPRLLMEELTWPEIEAAFKSGVETVVVTVGATEQHGPHIALSSDSVVGDAVGPGVARRIGRALVAPPIRVGVSPHHMMFPGTITVRQEILADLLREYVHSLAWHGFRHIVLIPTHGGNFTTIEQVTRQLTPLYPHVDIIGYSDAPRYIETLVASSRRLGVPLDAAGSHSGLSETAQVLALRPELVRPDRAEPGFMGDAYGVGDRMSREGTQAISPIGVLGDPRGARPEIGREYLNDLIAFLSEFARKARDAWRPGAPTHLPSGEPPVPPGPLADGVRLRRDGRYPEARAFLAASGGGRGNAAATIELARTLTLAGDLDAARAMLAPLTTHAESRVREQMHDELAYLDLYRGRFESAVAHKREARTIRAATGDRAGEAGKLFYIGYILIETDRLEQAEATFEEALRLAPSVSDVHLDLQHLLGLAEVARGRLTQAGVQLRAIEDGVLDREFASHVRRFYHLGGEILLARGRIDDALRNLEPTRGIYDHPLYRASLARAYERAGRPADAEQELRRILQMRDARLDVPIHYVKAHVTLARLAAAAGRRQEADDLYRKFLAFWADADVPLPSIAEAKAGVRR